MSVEVKPEYALSGYAEWMFCMCKSWKDIENRNWSLCRYFKPAQLPVRVYLHASKTAASREEINFIRLTLSSEERTVFDDVNFALLRGHIIGEVDITDCVTESKSPWFVGEFGFVLANPVLYDTPIPCKGKLGFFRPDIRIVNE